MNTAALQRSFAKKINGASKLFYWAHCDPANFYLNCHKPWLYVPLRFSLSLSLRSTETALCSDMHHELLDLIQSSLNQLNPVNWIPTVWNRIKLYREVKDGDRKQEAHIRGGHNTVNTSGVKSNTVSMQQVTLLWSWFVFSLTMCESVDSS